MAAASGAASGIPVPGSPGGSPVRRSRVIPTGAGAPAPGAPGAPAPGAPAPATPVETFAQALQKLKNFNEAQSTSPDLSGPIGGLNRVVKRLTNLHISMQSTLKDILAQINTMKVSNLTASKAQLAEYTRNMDIKLNEIQKLLPTNTSAPAPLTGGYQYSKSKRRTRKKSKTKAKSNSRRRRRNTRSKR